MRWVDLSFEPSRSVTGPLFHRRQSELLACANLIAEGKSSSRMGILLLRTRRLCPFRNAGIEIVPL